VSGYRARVEPAWDMQAWRAAARRAWDAGLAPEQIDWDGDSQAGLLPWPPLEQAVAAVRATALAVPPAFLELAARVACHRDPGRHALLYRLAWRIGQGERRVLERATDADVVRARALEQAVRRDSHKMKAFVRFRAVPGAEDSYVAWFEPEHWIVDRVAPFFARRFAGMRWAIITPYRSVRWDGSDLWAGPGGERADVPADDAHDGLWRTYYAHIFNPARLNVRMMRQEMPQKYWHLLPETRLLPELVRTAGARVREMAERAPRPPRRPRGAG
jgi:DNA polymerase